MKVKKLHEDAKIPTKNHNAAAYDLYALEDVIIYPCEKALIKTGISVELPKNTSAITTGRSGVSLKTPLIVITGTIDNDYRGEIGLIVYNGAERIREFNDSLKTDMVRTIENEGSPNEYQKLDKKVFLNSILVRKGDRIGQLKLEYQVNTEIEIVDELSETSRGANGFGSSGVR